MMSSILVATDLSEASDGVLRAAAALANLADAELHVIHALEVPMLPYSTADRAAASVDGWLAEARAALDEQFRRALPPQAEVSSVHLAVGSVHLAVLERAAEVAADLLVLGPHRLRPFGDRFLGSTADRVIRTASAPCLLVRGALDLPLRRLMLPTDLSEPAGGALRVALRWLAAFGAAADGDRRGAELLVVHVVPRMYEMPDFAFDQEVVVPEVERLIREALDEVEASAAVRERVTWGDVPADEILRVAVSEGADLLVLGTHGHGAVRRVLLGSVASALARGAPCSVLLVSPPSREGVKHE
jgi:nucleotide-binding universal stress UspA family protein